MDSDAVPIAESAGEFGWLDWPIDWWKLGELFGNDGDWMDLDIGENNEDIV